jgi:hypothetical protein
VTEQELRVFLEKINEDMDFRENVRRNPIGALKAAELGAIKVAPIAPNDEDALRRLASFTLQEDARIWTWIKKTLSRLFCGPGGTRSWECPKDKPT